MPRSDDLHVASLGRLGFGPASPNGARRRHKSPRHASRRQAAGQRTQECLDELREMIRGQLQSEEADLVDDDDDAKRARRAGIISVATSTVAAKVRGTMAVFATRAHAHENCALQRIASRFEYYAVKPHARAAASAGAQRPYLDRTGVARMLAHVQGNRSRKLVSAVMDALDTHHNGKIYFDEFVSFVSYDRHELADVAVRLRRKLKNGANSSLHHCFGLVANAKTQMVLPEMVQALVSQKLDVQLTPGEACWIAARIGPDLTAFKRYLKTNIQSLVASWTADDLWVSEIAIALGKNTPCEIEGYGPVPLVQAAADKHASGFPRFWVKTTLAPRHSAEGAPAEDEDENEDEDSSEDYESKASDSGSESESPRMTRSPKRRSKLLREERQQKAPVTQLEVAQTRRDAGLVADGFICIETPLVPRSFRNTQSRYLWIKKEATRFDLSADDPDAILELAVTVGHAAKLTSAIWTPPSRGFKRLAYNFGPAGKTSLGATHGEEAFASSARVPDCFLWYRKADPTYAREYLAYLRTSRLVTQGAGDEALHARLRERVRAQVAQLRAAQGARFDPVDILDQFAPHSDRLRKKQFVQGIGKLGIQLSPRDLANIFDKLDVLGANYVLREDVIDFFELSDKELEGILLQLRGYLRRAKREGESLLRIFKDLDTNGSGKLSARELHKLLRKMGILASLPEAQRLIDRIAANEHSVVDADDFLEFVQRGDVLRAVGARASGISSNVRAAAREFHAVARKQARLGTNSGRLSQKLNTRHAWKRLLGSDNDDATILSATRVRRVLHKRGLRLRMEEVRTLLRTLEPAFDKLEGISFESFDSFVKFVEPMDAVEDNPQPKDASSYDNGENNMDAHSARGGSPAARGGFRSALANLHADLSMMAVSQGVEGHGLYRHLFPRDKGVKVSTRDFLSGLDHVGALSRFRAASDREKLISYFDRNRDGMISAGDFARFIHKREGLEIDVLSSDDENASDDDDGNDDDHGPDRGGAGTSDGESSASDSQNEAGRGNESGLWWLHSGEVAGTSGPARRRRHRDSQGSDDERSDCEYNDASPRHCSHGSKAKSADEDDEDFYSELATNLLASDVRKNWLLHLDSIHVDARDLGPSRHVSQQTARAQQAVNVNLLQAAAESAAREYGGPLQLRRRFRKLDPRGSGHISKQGFAKVLRRVQLDIPRSERSPLQSLLSSKGRAGSRCVDYELFCDIVERSSEIQGAGVDRVHQRLGSLFKNIDARPVFESFDRKGEGSLSMASFRQALALCGARISKYDWSVLRPQLEQDGRVDYLALCELIETADLAHPLARRQNRKPDEVRLFRALAEHRSALFDTLDSADLRDAFEVYDEAGLGSVAVAEAVSALEDLVRRSNLLAMLPREILRSVVARYVSAGDQFDYLAFCEAFENSAVHIADQQVFLRRLSAEVRRALEVAGISFLETMSRHDSEGSGKLSRYAFRRSLRHDLGVRISERDLGCVMDLAETHGDGNVDYLLLESKMSLDARVVTGSALLRQREIGSALRRVLERRVRSDACFDLRACFHSYSGGRDTATTGEVGELLAGLGIYASEDDLAALCARGVLSIDAFSRFVDMDEAEWDTIAVRCHQRLEEVARQGLNFSHECALHRAPENAFAGGISRARFVEVCRRLGLPLSAADLDLVLRRFQDPNGGHLVAYQAFEDFVRARARRIDCTA